MRTGRHARLAGAYLILAVIALMPAQKAHATNTAPTISGTPPPSIAAGYKYWFQAKGYDANGDTLSYAIGNKPAWATFGTTTGALYGVPSSTQVGTYSNIVISVSDGHVRTYLPAFSITVYINYAPKISGTPPTSATVGTTYRFQPSASDVNGDKLTFNISNKPGWASFASSTGLLSGTPALANVGTNSNIVIGVTDGKVASYLPAFSITVKQITTGSVTLTWVPPTTNTDGTTLTNLAGYRISYGTSSTSLSQSVLIANAGVTRYVIDNLSAGTWYFGIQAYSSTGVQSNITGLAGTSL